MLQPRESFGERQDFPEGGSMPWRCWMLLALLFLASTTATRAQRLPTTAIPTAGASLEQALSRLQGSGVRLVFTSNVVRPDMVVAESPEATELLELLEEILAPHDLTVRSGVGGTLVVVNTDAFTLENLGWIQGVVRARGDDSPIEGVSIRVEDSDNDVLTGSAGSFRIPVPAGSRKLQVRRRGFVLEEIPVTVLPRTASQLTIRLAPAPVLEEEVLVTPSRVSLMREQPASPLALSRDDILALPHLSGDFFRSLSLLPGVTSNDVSAEFHVRGGRRDETQIILDGQELFETYHLKDFDSALSVVPPDTLESVDLSTGGFSVEHGDRMSGVLDMTTATPTGPHRTLLGIGLLNLQAGSLGSFSQGRGSWIAQGRRGAIDLAGSLLGNDHPQYWDGFGKLDYQVRPNDSLRLNALFSHDDLDLTEVIGDERKEISTSYSSSYVWLTHQALLGTNAFVATAVSQSRIDRNRLGLEREEDGQFDIRDGRDLTVLSVKQDWNLQLAKHHLKWGIGRRDFDTSYDYASAFNFDNPLARIRQNEEQGEIAFRGALREDDTSLYVSDSARFGDAVTLELGLRYDQHSLANEDLLSPRLNLAYGVGANGVLRAAVGRFNQSQRPYELQVEDGERSFRAVERSDHYVLGYERLFPTRGSGTGSALRIELYQRQVRNPLPRYENLYEPVNTFPEIEPDRVRIDADRSLAEGVEIFLRSRVRARTGWWINYAYATTEDEIGDEDFPRRFDQTHSFNFDVDQRLGKHWTLNVAWRYHTGWPTTPLMLEEVVNEDGEIELLPFLGRRFSARLPDYHRMDLRASRRWQRRSAEVTFYIDIQNVYDRRNLAGFDFEIDEEEGRIIPNAEEWSGALPSLGISIEF